MAKKNGLEMEINRVKAVQNLTGEEMKDVLWCKEIGSQNREEHDEWSGRVVKINS